MQYISFRSARILAGIANMLECFGMEASDLEIAAAMHAPFIFHLEDGHYFAGSRLYQPRWINLGLLPHGFRLDTCVISADSLPKFLRSRKTAMLMLQAPKDKPRLCVYTGYADRRYHFINLKQRNGHLPDRFSLSSAQLKRHLLPRVDCFVLSPCDSQTQDLRPILIDSLYSLTRYIQQVQERLAPPLTRSEYMQNEEFWLTLLLELGPMAYIAKDAVLSAALGSLHFYDHEPIYDLYCSNPLPDEIELNADLIRRCLLWYAELLLDQLASLFPEEEMQQIVMQSGLTDTWVFHCNPLYRSIDPHRNDFFIHVHSHAGDGHFPR